MSGHYYRVGVHGPPDPKKHPWVQARFEGGWWRLIHVPDVPGRHWAHDEVWFPVEAPPSELAPEPEGVEVDGVRFRVRADKVEYRSNTDGGWYPVAPVESFHRDVRVAVALGLVDQPPVPRALVEWLERCATRMAPSGYEQGRKEFSRHILDRIEAGEFGPDKGER